MRTIVLKELTACKREDRFIYIERDMTGKIIGINCWHGLDSDEEQYPTEPDKRITQYMHSTGYISRRELFDNDIDWANELLSTYFTNERFFSNQ